MDRDLLAAATIGDIGAAGIIGRGDELGAGPGLAQRAQATAGADLARLAEQYGNDAAVPAGRRGSPMEMYRPMNAPGVVNGITYAGHAFDAMQMEGFTPGVVEDTIADGVLTVGTSGRIAYYSPTNNITVITEPDGIVVTVTSGTVNVR